MEQWKPLTEFPNYSVSSHGRVRRDTRGPHTRPGKILKLSTDKDGYNKAHPHHNHKTYNRRVSRLVASAFIAPIPEGMVVNHIDGNKANDHLSNLEIVSISENTKHGFRSLGRRPQINPNRGTANGRSKLSDGTVSEIRKRYASERISQQALADEYGVHQTAISRIVRKQSY